MRIFGVAFLTLFTPLLFAGDDGNLGTFFSQLSKLEFAKAKQSARFEQNEELRSEMLRLADILSNAGQTDRPVLDSALEYADRHDRKLTIVRKLVKGYISLYYDEIKEDAYREFYSAYQLAKKGNDLFLKPCLFAMLEYHRSEIVQNSDAYLPYLDQFESIPLDTIDFAWLSVYKSIFYTSNFQAIDSNYFALAKGLDRSEANLHMESPMLAYVFYEKALNFELQSDWELAATYYRKVLKQATSHKFLWFIRFSSCIKLMMIAIQQDQFETAQTLFRTAKAEVNANNTLRTSFWLNVYGAELMRATHNSDSAFALLRTAFAQDYRLDFIKNSLEVNRLNVELETQEKENANLRLTQEKNWLVFSMSGLGLFAVLGYLVYRNRLAKSAMEIQQREVHSMKLEKQLKDQEITGIDQMIEAQEKERQRIANELHDNLGSHLASIKLYFQNLQQKVKDPAQNELFQKTDQLLEETYQQVRTLAHARNVGVNSKDGLMPAVRSFASKISGANKLNVEVEEHGMDTRLENSMEIMLFRIIQELTTNVIKHAKATEVTINLTKHDDSINLMVEDNGLGFDISQIRPRDTMGLHSIQKRVENLGGRVAIDSIINKGTTVIVDLPI
jgi:signal transduction histidine kinase